jgi:hypothetical protein
VIMEIEGQLSDADLSVATLRRANLRGAYLSDADLRRANLSDADLRGADLRGADLRGATLRDADLRDATLRRANLRGADLSGADLRRANLSVADLRGASLRGAYLSDADVPAIEMIDSKILEAIGENPSNIPMGSWHTCETAHCRSGWAITLAGQKGKDLEKKIGPSAAGALIYAASRPGKPVPNFYASTEEAFADIKKCAEEEKAAIDN